MRVLGAIAVLAGMFYFAAAGRAQIPDVLMAGQVTSAIAYGQPGWCAVTQGGSTIQRNQDAGTAVISFPELTLFDGTAYYLLNGQAHLRFNSSKAGVIRFKQTSYPQTISSLPFSGFSETTHGEKYLVQFSIAFSNSCTLPIAASFETP